MINTAFVNIWNKRVGAIAWDAETGTAGFEFEPRFLKEKLDLAPLKMPREQAERQIYMFPEHRNTNTFRGLPGLLADTLPDKYGKTLINTWLVQNGRPADSLNPVEMLCYVGKRGMGALEFEPAVPKINDRSTKIEIDELVTMARKVLDQRKEFNSHLNEEDQKGLTDIIKVGTSAGGAKAKALIAFNPATGEVRSGQADAPKDFAHWLLKFDGIENDTLGTPQGYGRVEMAYHIMAVACGIEMTECRLWEEQGRAHFMTRRFDREPGKGKLHMQSLCAMAHLDFENIAGYSYEQAFQTMRELHLPYVAAEQLFRRMVFNVMARNCDDHTKNIAFLMDKSGTWRLAPAFDLTYAYRPGSNWISRHYLSVNGKKENITQQDLLSVARSMSIKKGKNIITQIQEVIREWPNFAARTGTPASLLTQIGHNHLLL